MWNNLRFLRLSQSRLLPTAAAAFAIAESTATMDSSPSSPHFSIAHQREQLDRRPLLRLFAPNRALCEKNANDRKSSTEQYLRKRATLRQANDPLVRRFNTAQELDKLRVNQKEMLQRWERDEDGWRELPARAWPAFQPNVEQMEGIRKVANGKGCFATPTTSIFRRSTCQELLFQIATTLVFYNVNPKSGLEQFQKLAQDGHVDAMVACGVILVEGLGVPPSEEEGIAWLRKAAELGSSQAYYELGTVYYTGIADVLEEDAEKAFELFERAAQNKHVAAMYMMADCLAEGEGVTRDVARAVPLFYEAAEQGHRYARQRIRELLASHDSKNN